MGDETFRQILEQYRGKVLPSHDARVKHVKGVAERIVSALDQSEHPSGHLQSDTMQEGMRVGSASSTSGGSGSDEVEWEVFVIHDDEKNAFVLPNGKIFVHSGILPVCQDQDGLATVLGHEVRRFAGKDQSCMR